MSDAAPSSKSTSRWFWALLAAGLLARVLFLTSASLWTDEAATMIVSRVSLRQLPANLAAIESLPPLYFVLVHCFLQAFSDPLIAMRLLSLLCGAACLPLMWRLAGRLCPKASVAALALACASSAWIHASQDGRPYALVLLLALADYLLAWDLSLAWSAPKACALSVVASLGLCAHYHFGLLVAGNAVFFAVTFRRRPRELARRLSTLLLPALVTAALWPIARSQQTAFATLNWLQGRLAPPQAAEIMGQWLFDPSFLGLSLRGVMLAAGLACAGTIAAAVVRRGPTPALTFLLAYAGAGFIGLRLLESAFAVSLAQARYLLFLSPLFYCALADAVWKSLGRARPWVAAPFASLVLAGTAGYYLSTTALDPHLDRLAARVRALAGRPVIVHLNVFQYLPLRYYYLPEYRHYLIASQAAHLKGKDLPGGSGIIDDAGLRGLGDCLVIDPQDEIFASHWGRSSGSALAQALRVDTR